MSARAFGGSLLAALAFGLGGSAFGQSAVQWSGNGHWYRFAVDAQPLAWPSAKADAEAVGGYLATVTSMAENDFVLSVASDPDGWEIFFGGLAFCVGPWLGGFQPSGASEPAGGWQWVTGEPFFFQHWWWIEPNDGCGGEDYLHLLTQSATVPSNWWNDGGGDQCQNLVRSYVIEWSADCNGDGVVDYGQVRNGSLPDYDGDNIPDCCEAGTPCTAGNYPVQWRVEDGGNGHWYRIVIPGGPVGWVQARDLSTTLGGYLATPTNAAEDSFVASVASNPNGWNFAYSFGPWLGGYQLVSAADYAEPSGGWRWISGEAWSWAPWGGPGYDEPNNCFCNCGPENYLHYKNRTINVVDRVWNDLQSTNLKCAQPSAFVVEWSADCDSDGAVDYGHILRGEVADVNGNGIPDTCDCLADINQSGTIDAEDLAQVLFAWGMPGAKAGGADINRDATVDANDLSLVLGSWGPCPN